MKQKNIAESQASESDKDYQIGLKFESLFDEARSMAYTLKKINDELHLAAACEGDYDGGYPIENLLPNLCKIMFADEGYWRNEKYK